MLRDLNWVAVAIAVVLIEAIGWLWYGVVFLEPWTATQSFAPTGDPAVSMSIGLLITILQVVGLAWALRRLGAEGLVAHLGGALALWLFFDFTTMAVDYVYVGHKPAFVAINLGFQLVAYMTAGAVLGLIPRRRAASE